MCISGKKKSPWAKETLKLSPLSGLNLAGTKRAWARAQRPLLDTHTHTHTHTRPLLAYVTPPGRDGQRDSTHSLPRLSDPSALVHMQTAGGDNGGGSRDCGEGWKDGDGLGELPSDGFGDLSDGFGDLLPSVSGRPEVWRHCV